jgi:hypothetical protein
MLLIGDAISRLQSRANTIGKRLDNAFCIQTFNDANNYFCTNYKMPTTQRVHDLLYYPGILHYALPDDFDGMFAPERPFGTGYSPVFNRTTEKEFFHFQDGRSISLVFDRENQFLLMNDASGTRVILNDCGSLTDNGTVTGSGSASALVVDDSIYVQGNGSIGFTSSGSGAVITFAGFNQEDVSDGIFEYGTFFDLQVPVGGSVTSAILRVGDDASNYYQIASALRFRGDSIVTGWGPIGGRIQDAASVGSPTGKMSWAQVVLVGETAGHYRIDNVMMAKPTYYQLPYYSLYNVKSAAGVYKNEITALDDSILCPPKTEIAFELKALEIACALRLKDQGIAAYAARELLGNEGYMKVTWPKQIMRVSTTRYKNTKF